LVSATPKTGNDVFPLRADSLAYAPDATALASVVEKMSEVVIWKVAPVEQHSVRRSDAELQALWSDLASPDAGKAYQAINALGLSPAQTVPMLQRHLQAPPADPRVERLLKEMDSNQFNVRQQAEAELAKLGLAALPALASALQQKPALEMRQRLERLVEQSQTLTQALRAVHVLERTGTPEAKQMLEGLAKNSKIPRLADEAKASLGQLSKRDTGRP
jgi:hypothetical protein